MIEQIIKDYYKAWNNALATNDSSQVREKMSPEFVGYWCHSAWQLRRSMTTTMTLTMFWSST
ncbi:hypothetical protein [Piscibacillus salipiscarius]|uniref:hypothetical protein n=1 Tax=Piscibacillus salipiscarius TaxID=299480 RepID=UPI0006D27FB8|nr:hypothetical protein [Piscibacillus salipiscarius]